MTATSNVAVQMAIERRNVAVQRRRNFFEIQVIFPYGALAGFELVAISCLGLSSAEITDVCFYIQPEE